MNAINLDITDDLRDYDSYVSRSKFHVQQALSRKYCRLLSRSRQKPWLFATPKATYVQSEQE